jgi:drug/metabolite transporter (DMT)-like permease
VAALLALLSSALWGTSDFLGGSASRRLPAGTVLGVSQLVALLALVPLGAALGGFDLDRSYVGPAVLAGVAGVVALGAFYRALATGTMGVVAPIAALGVVVPVGAGLLDGERPGALRLLGIAIAVVGIVLASGPELSGAAGARPLVLAGVAALGFGLVLVLVARASDGGSTAVVVMTLMTMRLVSVGLLVLLLVLVARPRGFRLGASRTDLPVLATIGAFDVGANGTYALASQSDLVSVAAVLASLYPVVTVLLARRFDDERLVGVQLWGVVLALAGVVLLAAG